MSQIINIEQLRAKNALAADGVKKQDGEGDALSGFSSLIINNGLPSAIAFAVYKGSATQAGRIATAIATHLESLPGGSPFTSRTDSAVALRDALCHCDAFTVRRCTDEALAFLSYLKRFQR